MDKLQRIIKEKRALENELSNKRLKYVGVNQIPPSASDKEIEEAEKLEEEIKQKQTAQEKIEKEIKRDLGI